jgi:hypothetical protein
MIADKTALKKDCIRTHEVRLQSLFIWTFFSLPKSRDLTF